MSDLRDDRDAEIGIMIVAVISSFDEKLINRMGSALNITPLKNDLRCRNRSSSCWYRLR